MSIGGVVARGWRVMAAGVRFPGAYRAVRAASRGVASRGLQATLGAQVPHGEPRASLSAAGERERVARAVERAAKFVPGADCLPRAVATAALLARRGDTPEIVLGCRRGEQEWLAHAWVVVGEQELPRGTARGFAELARCRATNHWVPAPSDRPS